MKFVWCGAICLGIVAAAGGEAWAQAKSKGVAVTGIDKIHSQVKVGNKICMADHDHQGEAEMPSRKGAEAAAIRKWQIFTVDEYGRAWGSYAASVAKKMTCKPSGARWSCHVSSRPCRPAKV